MEIERKIVKALEDIGYNPLSEQILEILQKRFNCDNAGYFRVIISFYLAQIASNMRATLSSPVLFDKVPINVYACGLMPSGSGKTFTTHILEDMVVNKFKEVFVEATLPQVAELTLDTLINKEALLQSKSTNEVSDTIRKQFNSLGSLPYVFDSGTGAAFRQVYSKAQMCGLGALSMVCDEIGKTLIGNEELTTIGYQTFDAGLIKQKLLKSSVDNQRIKDYGVPVPCNMLWFGTPAGLLNGAKEEDAFTDLLDQGYARRMLFGWGTPPTISDKTAEQVRDDLLKLDFKSTLDSISSRLEGLAGLPFANKNIVLEDDVELMVIDYQCWCNDRADAMQEANSLKESELRNRHFKAVKLAGVYAFIDNSPRVTLEHLVGAIHVVEDSGECFAKILNKERPYVKLAKYLSITNTPQTYADLMEKLPYFKGDKKAKDEMINSAIAWGYGHNINIKTYTRNKIDFVYGEKLEETDLDKLIISVSNHEAYNYINQEIPWSKLPMLGNKDGFHWCNHHLMQDASHPEYGCHRAEKFVQQGFNMIVLDVDCNVKLDMAQQVLKDYTYLIYTTKRHTDTENRFRIIIPMKYKLNLSTEDFKAFMSNIYEYLPFKGLDESTNQRSRKWLTNQGTVIVNQADDQVLFDPRPFVPHSAQNEERINEAKSLGNLDHLSRWFLDRINKLGERNNQLFNYGAMLKDGGLTQAEVEQKVIELNSRLSSPLDITELQQTIFYSLASRE